MACQKRKSTASAAQYSTIHPKAEGMFHFGVCWPLSHELTWQSRTGPSRSARHMRRKGASMTAKLRIRDVERIVVDVPFTPRCQEWNAREVWQWRISEIIRITTDTPDLVGYGETILHYTWGRVS